MSKIVMNENEIHVSDLSPQKILEPGERAEVLELHPTDSKAALGNTSIGVLVPYPLESVTILTRCVEVVIALAALSILLPVKIIVALIIKLGSPGPALFFQKRLGLGAREFRFVKYRTLYADARDRFPELYQYSYSPHDLKELHFKVTNDPRVTPQGRWLRKSTLDELPNFWCLLTGEMALVGPRPEIPEMLPYYKGRMLKKFAVRPGITGLAQVSGRGRLSFDILWPELFKKQLAAQYNGKRVLILGADGFLGANCAIALHGLGAYVTVLSRRDQCRVEFYADKVVYGDLANINTAREVIQDQQIILDFVGRTGAVESNVDSYHNFDEQHPLAPDSLYAVHKIAMENYLRVFAKTEGLKSVVIRLSNPYGPNVEQKLQSYGLINIFLRKALNHEAITIFGDGSQRRDYIHTRDVAFAFLSAAVQEKCYGEVFNLGGDTDISIREVAEIIVRAAGSTHVEYADWPKEHQVVETGDYRSDLGKLNSLVNLPPKLAFQDSLEQLIHYYKENTMDVNSVSTPTLYLSKCK